MDDFEGLERGDLRSSDDGELPTLTRSREATGEGDRDDSERERQALVSQMPRTVLSRLSLLSTLIATLVVAGSAGINPI